MRYLTTSRFDGEVLLGLAPWVIFDGEPLRDGLIPALPGERSGLRLRDMRFGLKLILNIITEYGHINSMYKTKIYTMDFTYIIYSFYFMSMIPKIVENKK